METTKIGIVGCGNISGVYFQNARKLEILETVACADLIPERARAKAEEFGVAKACTTEELLAKPCRQDRQHGLRAIRGTRDDGSPEQSFYRAQ